MAKIRHTKFYQVCRDNQVTAYRIGKEIGVMATTVATWMVGSAFPNVRNAQKVIDYFATLGIELTNTDFITFINE